MPGRVWLDTSVHAVTSTAPLTHLRHQYKHSVRTLQCPEERHHHFKTRSRHSLVAVSDGTKLVCHSSHGMTECLSSHVMLPVDCVTASSLVRPLLTDILDRRDWGRRFTRWICPSYSLFRIPRQSQSSSLSRLGNFIQTVKFEIVS